MAEQFDILIVGGGAAGCAVANRVSANPKLRVALIEAGEDTPPDHTDAVLWDSYPIVAYFDPRHHWGDLRVFHQPEGSVAPAIRTPRRYEQGKVMGGGSSINGMMANRGNPADYDGWAAAGATGWGWQGVLPYFKRLETDLDVQSPEHGADGPVPIRRVPWEQWGGFSQAAGVALRDAGLPAIFDQNGGDFIPSHFPITVNNEAVDRRASSATSYLTSEVRTRPNLTIMANTRVRRLLLDGTTVTGVEVVGKDGVARTIAAAEVVLSMGAIHTPAMLLKAGIGPGETLMAAGVPVVADRAGVGRNLQEHPQVAASAWLSPDARIPWETRRHIFGGFRWSSGVEGCPAVDMYGVIVNRGAWHPLGQRMGGFLIWINKAFSQGNIQLASNDPDRSPIVNLDLLKDPRDLRRIMDGLIFLEALYRHPALAQVARDAFPTAYTEKSRDLAIVSEENRRATQAIADLLDADESTRASVFREQVAGGLSLHDIVHDEPALEQFVRERVHGTWHCCGSAKIGCADDPAAVVDSAGRVYGVKGLRVADASVMPSIPCANTNLPAIMIGEKMADAVLADWA